LEENGKKRRELLAQIEPVMIEFNKEKSSSSESSERAKVNLL